MDEPYFDLFGSFGLDMTTGIKADPSQGARCRERYPLNKSQVYVSNCLLLLS